MHEPLLRGHHTPHASFFLGVWKAREGWCRLCYQQDFLSLGGQERGASIEAMLTEEVETRVPTDFLSLQPLIGAQHRQLLASWIVTVRIL